MVSGYQVSSLVESISDCGMRSDEHLNLADRLEFPYFSLPYPDRLVGLPDSVVGIIWIKRYN
jgi:hypothetical protein